MCNLSIIYSEKRVASLINLTKKKTRKIKLRANNTMRAQFALNYRLLAKPHAPLD